MTSSTLTLMSAAFSGTRVDDIDRLADRVESRRAASEARIHKAAAQLDDPIDYFIVPSADAYETWLKAARDGRFLGLMSLVPIAVMGAASAAAGLVLFPADSPALLFFGPLSIVTLGLVGWGVKESGVSGVGQSTHFRSSIVDIGANIMGVGRKALHVVEGDEVRTIHLDAVGSISKKDDGISIRSRFGDQVLLHPHPRTEQDASVSSLVEDLNKRLRNLNG